MESYLPRDHGMLTVVPFREGNHFKEIGVIHHFIQSERPTSPEQLNNMILQATNSLDGLIHGPMAMTYSGRDYSSLRGHHLVPLIILVETRTVVYKYIPTHMDIGEREKWDDDEPPTKSKKETKPNANTLTLLL